MRSKGYDTDKVSPKDITQGGHIHFYKSNVDFMLSVCVGVEHPAKVTCTIDTFKFPAVFEIDVCIEFA